MLDNFREGINNVNRHEGWKATAVAESYCPFDLGQPPSSNRIRSVCLSHPINEITGSANILYNVSNCSFIINIDNFQLLLCKLL